MLRSILLVSSILSALAYTPALNRGGCIPRLSTRLASTCCDPKNAPHEGRRRFLNVLPTFFVASCPLPSLASQTTPLLNARAPDFSLPSSTGSQVSLASLLDSKKYTVLYFYPGAFTSGCTLEARGFQKDSEEYAKLNAQVVGVSVDSVEKNQAFCESEGLNFFMLSDARGDVSKAYGAALSIPGLGSFSNRQTYIIDPSGNVKAIFTDVESRIPKHSAEVLEKLKELKELQT